MGSLFSALMPSNQQPPRIFVTVSTSGPTLSKSGRWPFIITLEARVEYDSPITIDAFHTVLHPRPQVILDLDGLTFKDKETAQLADRPSIHVQYHIMNDPSTVDSEHVVEIPSIRSKGKPWTVSHAFRFRGPPLTGFEEDIQRALDQTTSFSEGHNYEIGLGDNMSTVRSWSKGSKSDVFASGPRYLAKDRPDLPLALVNEATFDVVA